MTVFIYSNYYKGFIPKHFSSQALAFYAARQNNTVVFGTALAEGIYENTNQ